jgi:polysaccharide export outer membrane protein
MAAALAGCGAFPAAGPYGAEIRHGTGSDPTLQYSLIPLSEDVLDVLTKHSPSGLSGSFTDRRPAADIRFGIGDIVAISIFEAAAGGLFIPADAGARAGNFVTLPDQPVDRSGNIQVPYAGSIAVVGRTPREVQIAIEERIRQRAIEPQAVVTLKEQRSALVSVLGEVNLPNRLPLTASGDRLLDVISRAGGPKNQGYETHVTLQRGQRKSTVSFLRLVGDPSQNVYVQPNDTVFVYQEPQTFLAFGATGENGQIAFGKERLSLAEAVAKSRGLLDERADPGSVFVFRLEPRRVAEAIGADISRSAPYLMPSSYNSSWEPTVPVIYNLNLRAASGYFHARRFQMRSHDVLYVSNAASVEVTKFLVFLQNAVALVREGNFAAHELRCKGAVGPACGTE